MVINKIYNKNLANRDIQSSSQLEKWLYYITKTHLIRRQV
jgi:hypothetical protein